ncbi:MAG: ISL3 family transposase [Ktedonobacteraceae bacterium]
MSTISHLEWTELLNLPEDMAVQMCLVSASQLTVRLFCRSETASCPHCHTPSQRIHSHYGRTVADLPVSGRQVRLLLTVRKFLCGNAACEHKMFTERLDELVRSYARMTKRLAETLQTLGFATCGELGEHLAPKLGMQVSGPTVLRLMRTRVYTPPSDIPIVGIDDWAWKKGMTYGTLIVDLQSRRPIEVLEDRSAKTAEAWLAAHPEILVVSRDRGGDYAAAARRAAPQAQQVADKFHLLKNLRERLQDLATRKHSSLPIVAEVRSDAIPDRARGKQRPKGSADSQQTVSEATEKQYRTIPPTPYARPPRDPTPQLRKQGSRARRQALYENIHLLSEQGMGIRAIAKQLKICRPTIRRYLRSEEFPEHASYPPRPPKGSILDQFKPYIFQRWEQGCRNSVQIYDEITARGYSGSTSLLRNFLAGIRKQHQEKIEAVQTLTVEETAETLSNPDKLPPKPSVTRRMSPAKASWLLVSQKKELDQRQRQYVEQICQSDPDLDAAYQLAQQFVPMLAEHRAEDLDPWLAHAEQSGLPELRSLAKGMRKDYDAVREAVTSEWSNGQVEAQVNCLKLQKRIVFGRANFDLLRLRVLCRV